jgi:hypothetical protein
VRSADVPSAATSERTSASSAGNGARAAYVCDGGLICTIREARRTQRRALDMNRILKRSRSLIGIQSIDFRLAGCDFASKFFSSVVFFSGEELHSILGLNFFSSCLLLLRGIFASCIPPAGLSIIPRLAARSFFLQFPWNLCVVKTELGTTVLPHSPNSSHLVRFTRNFQHSFTRSCPSQLR